MADRTHVVLNVPDISCNHCKMAIEGALAGLGGRGERHRRRRGEERRRRVRRRTVDRERIAATIAGEGYPVAGVHAFED